MSSGRRLGSVSLAASVSLGQLQAPSGAVKVTRVAAPLPRLVKRAGGSWCACVGVECCPPKKLKLKITEVISLAEEKVLKLPEQYLDTFAHYTCLFSLRL